MKEITSINTIRGELDIIDFCHKNGVTALQLTQGSGTAIGGNDEPGFVQLSTSDAAKLAVQLVLWIQEQSKIKAEKIQKEIDQNEALKRTIFSEAVACEKFIDDFEVPSLCVDLLNKINL